MLPDPASVRALLLDAGGVLVRPDFERVAEALRAQGVTAEAAGLRAAEAPVKRELDRTRRRGTATDEERGWVYFNLLLRHAGIARSPATDAALAELKAWHDRHCLWDDVPDGVGAASGGCGRRGCGWPSSPTRTAPSGCSSTASGFLDLFDEVLDSAVEGVEKPDPRIFRLALERLGARAEEALFVGDIYHVDVVGGRAAGLRVVLVDEAGLYDDADCPRVRSLVELADHLAPGAGHGGIFC